MKNKETARRLRDALNKKELTASELAKRSGVSKASISQYMNGSHVPSNISASKLANVLDVNPLYLMGFDLPTEVPEYNPLQDANWKKFEAIYHIQTGSLELLRLYNDLGPADQKQVLDYARFLFSQKE